MINKYVGIILCMTLFYSCGNADRNEAESKLKVKIENLKEENTKLNDRLKEAVIQQQVFEEEINNLQNELKKLKLKESPLGVYLETNFASESEYYKFGKDSLVWHSWGNQDNCLVGKWKLEDNWVQIKFYKQIGKRGIGEPLPPPEAIPGNYVDRFDEYEDYIEEVTDSTYKTWESHLDWREVYDYINSNDEMNLYVIKNYTNNLDISEIDVEPKGKYPQASYRLLDIADLKNISSKELRIMRNEVFARHHYEFKSEELKDYFSKQSWYSAERNNVDQYLSRIEEENIKLIKLVEAEK
ncbi:MULTISPECIES: YARHG domain-containing protein [unclassified Carboxylicivirga]|uniref:YARHG domain-containing protein n=1 Tax=Carboxylicivirga TaxID=1628153 RepID=UPI003D347C88